jgi:hypothetical protein
MKVFDLCCGREHRFEGWFASEAEYERQLALSLVECPVCASREIRRLPSAPRLNLSQSQQQVSPDAAQRGEQASAQLQAMWLQMARQIIANTDDVGDRFAEEARRIHYREAEDRAIRGTASAKEAVELAEEGIEVISLPLPAAMKGPMQ